MERKKKCATDEMRICNKRKCIYITNPFKLIKTSIILALFVANLSKSSSHPTLRSGWCQVVLFSKYVIPVEIRLLGNKPDKIICAEGSVSDYMDRLCTRLRWVSLSSFLAAAVAWQANHEI